MMHQQGDLFGGDLWQKVERGELYYDPHFLNHLEADNYFDQLRKTLPWHQEHITMFGKSNSNWIRRWHEATARDEKVFRARLRSHSYSMPSSK